MNVPADHATVATENPISAWTVIANERGNLMA